MENQQLYSESQHVTQTETHTSQIPGISTDRIVGYATIRGNTWFEDMMEEMNPSFPLQSYSWMCALNYFLNLLSPFLAMWLGEQGCQRVWLSFMRHLLRMRHPSLCTVSYLIQLPVFSLLAKPFIATAFSHENPLALIKTCADV